MLVVDASVALKWFLNEQNSDKALTLFKKPYKLVAPDIIRIEVLATLTKAVRKKLLSAEHAQLQMQRWRDAISKRAIIIIEHDSDYIEAGKLSLEMNHPLYDCSYLAAAKKLHVPLATADRKLADVSNKLDIQLFEWDK